MTSADRVRKLCIERNIAIAKIERDLGFPNACLRGMKGDLPGDKLFLVADYLGVDPRWLVSGESHDAELSPEENQLLATYRKLDDFGKSAATYIVNREYERIERERDDRDNLIALPRSRQAVSAGTGIYLGAEDMECVILKKTDMTRKTAFIVPVRGDSMFPLYRDGDSLLVSRDTVDIGEIGIFFVDGSGYVKRRGENALISINPDYPDIPITESSRCVGRVIGVLSPDMIV